MNRLIKELKAIKGLKVVCPYCDEEINIRRLEIADMYANDNWKISKLITKLIKEQKENGLDIKNKIKELRKQRKDKPLRVTRAAESTNIGKIVEKIVPSFQDFPYERSDCRALFEPIDYVIFNGLSKSKITNIEVVDVKTGGARLTPREKTIQASIEAGKVSHEVIKEAKP